MKLTSILEKAKEYADRNQCCVIAIDGRAAAGKSTLADRLKTLLGGTVIHMDDFFLPLELRTTERLDMPGGNVHYERFLEEVVPYIAGKEDFSYGKFDCSVMGIRESVHVIGKGCKIVEGAYCCHPVLGRYADITVFMDVSPEEQMERILLRNGPDKAERFRKEWIPLEEKYFRVYNLQETVDIYIDQ